MCKIFHKLAARTCISSYYICMYLTILDSGIFDLEAYKVFRLDRSQKTHPPDPHDPKKFRKYGGGVLIAIKTQLVVQTNYIELKSKSEIYHSGIYQP